MKVVLMCLLVLRIVPWRRMLGLCVGEAGVVVWPGLDGQNAPGLVQHTLAWSGVLCDACSASLV